MTLNKNLALSDSGFIFNPTNGDSFSTNMIGLKIISLMKEGKSKKDIVTSLAQHYEIHADALEKDLNDFFSSLQNFQLLNDHE